VCIYNKILETIQSPNIFPENKLYLGDYFTR